MAEILKYPEQHMLEWLPEHLARKACSGEGKWTGKKKVVGVKNYQPVFHYMVIYPRKRFINKSDFIVNR